MKLEYIRCPYGPEDFALGHEFSEKPKHWNTYGQFILDACGTIGVPVSQPRTPLHSFQLQFTFETGHAMVGICYADEPTVIGEFNNVDGILKMRWHPKRMKLISAGGLTWDPGTVQPAGFGMGFPFDPEQIQRLRRMKDEEEQDQDQRLFYTAGTFRTIQHERMHPGSYPNRARFRKALEGQCPSPLGLEAWLEQIARHRTVLNLCGNGNSIDRKVVQMCAIGTAIISDRGLEDLHLPWGGRFVHGENVWFVDEPEEVVGLRLDRTTIRALTTGSRLLYEKCLAPARLGKWYMKCAAEWARQKVAA